MLEKRGKIFTCVGVTMWQMWRRRGRTSLYGNTQHKHIVEKHQGVMSIPMFSHFKMELIQIFSKPQRRKADEGVRIFHLDPDLRMNSKNDFLQGTNLYLQPPQKN